MKYRIVCYTRIDPEPEDELWFDSLEEAQADLEQSRFLQPENIYKLEEIEDEFESKD